MPTEKLPDLKTLKVLIELVGEFEDVRALAALVMKPLGKPS